MILDDFDNNFVFINALRYTIYAYYFILLSYKPPQKTKKI